MAALVITLLLIGGFCFCIYLVIKFLRKHPYLQIVSDIILCICMVMAIASVVSDSFDMVEEQVSDKDVTSKLENMEWNYQNGDFYYLEMSVGYNMMYSSAEVGKYLDALAIWDAYKRTIRWDLAWKQGMEGADERANMYRQKALKRYEDTQYPDNKVMFREKMAEIGM